MQPPAPGIPIRLWLSALAWLVPPPTPLRTRGPAPGAVRFAAKTPRDRPSALTLRVKAGLTRPRRAQGSTDGGDSAVGLDPGCRSSSREV